MLRFWGKNAPPRATRDGVARARFGPGAVLGGGGLGLQMLPRSLQAHEAASRHRWLLDLNTGEKCQSELLRQTYR